MSEPYSNLLRLLFVRSGSAQAQTTVKNAAADGAAAGRAAKAEPCLSQAQSRPLGPDGCFFDNVPALAGAGRTRKGADLTTQPRW